MNREILLGKIPLLIGDWKHFQIYKEKIIDTCLKLERQNVIESNISIQAKKNLWESDFDFLEKNNELLDLKLWLIEKSESMINKINNSNYKIVITESWAHVTRPGGYHRPHYHSNSTWSGIFYIYSDIEEQGNNWYLPYYMERKPGLDFADDRISSKFVPGRLILFPSMLMHDAEPYQGNNARILIGFNIICL
jgi:uncharacterized protein (TIGR02466 family)